MKRPSSLSGSLLFHLNLSYSAIEVAQRGEVVRRCYRPLLELVDRLPWLTLTLEASGSTLEMIEELDPEWIMRLRELVGAGRVEFVGSGDSQLIGPLVPASVNAWNQRLGQQAYERMVGQRPTVALVNEMAWSQGVVDAYVAAGYTTLITEWNNPRRVHPEWDDEWRYGIVRTPSPTGAEVDVLWADAVAFQKIQRAVSGELSIDDYADWVMANEGERPRHLFVYANDAEIFDFRPGRFDAEPPLDASESEWVRMEAILTALHARGLAFTSPAQVVASDAFHTRVSVVLNAAADPIPVKKQPKYNASRWALTGRDDVRLNASCFARARQLEARDASPEDWRELCRAWRSDLRTHLTEGRWANERTRFEIPEAAAAVPPVPRALTLTNVSHGARTLHIETDDVRIALLPRRGLAIEALVFPSVSDRPLCGTIPHGFYDEIDWAADFYTGHAVLDVPAKRRVTDLARVEPEVAVFDDRIEVRARIETELGPLEKCVRVFADSVELSYGFSAWGERVPSSLRAGMVTLLPSESGALGDELWTACSNGGAVERFPVQGDFDHGASVSPLVSSRTLFGATDGRLGIDDGHVALELSWPNWRVAALPQMTCRRLGTRRFVRVAFSLAEIDETHRPGASLLDFELALKARRLSA